MFTEDELDQARAVPVLEIAERHGAKLKTIGQAVRGARALVCGGDDRFWVVPSLNVAGCRGCDFRGDAIALEMHLSGGSFVDAVRALIGKDAGTPTRRQPTPDEIAAREAREAERRRAEAEEQARNASSAAKIVARLQPVVGTPGEAYLRDVRMIDVSHWAIRRVLEDVDALGWCERTFFRQEDPQSRSRAQRPMARRHRRDPDRSHHRRAHRRDHPNLHPPRPQGLQGDVARRRWAAGDHPPVARRRGGERPAWLRGDRVGAVGDDDGLRPDVGLRLDDDDGGFPRSRRRSNASRSSPTTTERRRTRSPSATRPRARSASGGPTLAARR